MPKYRNAEIGFRKHPIEKAKIDLGTEYITYVFNILI